jgi:drug/metabolite transporter (DMT)-like permease
VLISSKLVRTMPVLPLVASQLLVAALASLALLIVRVTIFNGELQLPATEMQWAVSVATGVFGGAAPFILYLEATRRIPTTTVSQFSTLVPVIALIGGVVFLNDVTTPVQLLGTAIVVVSLSLLARYARAH